MEWLREVAGIIAKQNRGMMWITPVGFVVLHENGKPKEVRLATADRMILVYHHDDKQKIDVRKQVDGIVAHLVHSMDAAHMMRTINEGNQVCDDAVHLLHSIDRPHHVGGIHR